MREVSEDEYEYLLYLAKAGVEHLTTADPQAGSALLVLQQAVDRRNGITRDKLLVRWQSVPVGMPSGGAPAQYPAFKTITLENYQRKLTRDDVNEALRGESTTPALVHVTKDPLGLVGWTELDVHNFDA